MKIPARLYGNSFSTYTRRVRLALHEKGLEAEDVEALADERRQPAFRALNPFGRIPVLVEGDLVLYESTAILRYLEESFPEPALVGATAAERARTDQLVKLCDLEFTPFSVAIMRQKRFEPEERWDRAAMDAARPRIEAYFAWLDAELGGDDHLGGNGGAFGLADLVHVPFLHFHELYEVELPDRIAAWWARLAERPSVLATVPEK